MPEHRLHVLLAGYRRRLWSASALMAALVGAAAAGAIVGAGRLTSLSPSAMRIAGGATFVIVVVLMAALAWRQWTSARVARAIERRIPLDNLVVTAEEVAAGRTSIRHDAIREEVFAGAVTRLEQIDAARVQPLGRSALIVTAAVVAMVTLMVAIPQSRPREMAAAQQSGAATAASLAPGDVRVVITPPTYARREVVEAVNPSSVTALEGSTVRLEVRMPPQDVTLHELDGSHQSFELANGVAVLDLVATTSRPLLVRQMNAGVAADRLVHLRVQRDERAVVSIRQPAKDLVFAEPRGQVALLIEAQDDVGLQSLALRYTRVSGSGETFTFEEGEWPIEITREGVGRWRARGVLSLERLNLQDGDTLVYRAIARDARPGADPSTSDSYLIEIGGLMGVASQGFALPEERDRHAISQQMVIVKTERLHAAKGTMDAEAFLEQAQLLAVEQRMVQAEFVFMTGGHVHDEVEEAEQSNEIAEGRLENSATVEMMNAIREMSRAEARLNAGDTGQALPYERAALKALQRAFDRRRYFLRTLPDRARIDMSRRLTGELENARSSAVVPEVESRDPLVQNARAVLTELSLPGVERGNLTLVASRLLALGSGSEALQRAALQLSAARDAEARAAAVRQARQAIVDLLRSRMSRQLPSQLQREPLKGRLVQELPAPGVPR
jgi:hypothetical protein